MVVRKGKNQYTALNERFSSLQLCSSTSLINPTDMYIRSSRRVTELRVARKGKFQVRIPAARGKLKAAGRHSPHSSDSFRQEEEEHIFYWRILGAYPQVSHSIIAAVALSNFSSPLPAAAILRPHHDPRRSSASDYPHMYYRREGVKAATQQLNTCVALTRYLIPESPCITILVLRAGVDASGWPSPSPPIFVFMDDAAARLATDMSGLFCLSAIQS